MAVHKFLSENDTKSQSEVNVYPIV
jgi:hypothetical protein